MDVVRSPSTKSRIKKFWYVPVLAVIATFGVMALGVGHSSFVVDSESIILGTVERGNFEVLVRGQGVLAPKEIRWVSSEVDGRVERILVKPGASVKAGDLLIEVTNPDLNRQLEQTTWELEALEVGTKAQEIVLSSELLDQEALLRQAELNYERRKLEFEAQATLHNKGSSAVSKLDYERSKLDTAQLLELLKIERERYKNKANSVAAQIEAQNATLSSMRKNLESVQHQVDSLNVYASVTSVVQDIDVELGEQVAAGTNLVLLAETTNLIAELRIPEIHTQDIQLGQAVKIDTRNTVIDGSVSRIDPRIVNGTVQVDVEFADALPSEARPNLSVDGSILIAQLQDTLFLDRPVFAQSASSMSLYQVSAAGDEAQRIRVKLGVGSTNKIEVLEGLAVGDKVIISDSSNWASHENITIN